MSGWGQVKKAKMLERSDWVAYTLEADEKTDAPSQMADICRYITYNSGV